jgi:hypothetical protein
MKEEWSRPLFRCMTSWRRLKQYMILWKRLMVASSKGRDLIVGAAGGAAAAVGRYTTSVPEWASAAGGGSE